MTGPRPAIEVLPVVGVPEVQPGDDLGAMLEFALRAAGVRDGDVVIVTSKIVSKAEGRLASGDDRARAVAAETVRVVARRGDLVIAETAHGFVCANAGVDASNVDAGSLALLPVDPDASASALRAELSGRLGVNDLAVVVTDTFGRAWRVGVVNVAIGCAGLPATVDLRGRSDDRGRELEATEVALADEVAAAGGLVMPKDARIPAAIVRGVDRLGGDQSDARSLVRPAHEDLFRTSPMQALHDRHPATAFGSGDVPRAAIEEAIGAACAASPGDGTPSWRFSVLTSEVARRRYLAVATDASHADDAVRDVPEDPAGPISEGALLRAAPVLIVPWLSLGGIAAHTDPERSAAERDALILSAGTALQNLLLALSAQAISGRWIASPISRRAAVRSVLGVPEPWLPLGTVACGPTPPGGAPEPHPAIDPDQVTDWA